MYLKERSLHNPSNDYASVHCQNGHCTAGVSVFGFVFLLDAVKVIFQNAKIVLIKLFKLKLKVVCNQIQKRVLTSSKIQHY